MYEMEFFESRALQRTPLDSRKRKTGRRARLDVRRHLMFIFLPPLPPNATAKLLLTPSLCAPLGGFPLETLARQARVAEQHKREVAGRNWVGK